MFIQPLKLLLVLDEEATINVSRGTIEKLRPSVSYSSEIVVICSSSSFSCKFPFDIAHATLHFPRWRGRVSSCIMFILTFSRNNSLQLPAGSQILWYFETWSTTCKKVRMQFSDARNYNYKKIVPRKVGGSALFCPSRRQFVNLLLILMLSIWLEVCCRSVYTQLIL